MTEVHAPTHTPGPWLAAAKPSSLAGWPVVAPSRDGRLIAAIAVAQPWSGNEQSDEARAFNVESAANASLIAAAPDLLAALKALRSAVAAEPTMQGRQYDGLGIQVNHAIAKAEGRS